MPRLIRGFRPSIDLLEQRLAFANDTAPGAISFPAPTLTNISVEWLITGDDDLDASVGVRYRQEGASTWLGGLPLRRVPAGSNAGHSWLNKFAGSVFDVQPGTAYEVELTLTDPDGGSTGPQVRTVTTRSVPVPAANANVRPVTPATFAGVAGSAQPGDILELADGTYNAFTFTRDGTAAAPIVIRSLTGNAIIDGGGGGANAIELANRKHVHLVGLKIIDGRIKLNDTDSIAIIGCTILTDWDGIVGYAANNRPQNAYIADNTILGPHLWENDQLGANGADLGEGIELTGPGHVIIHNTIKGFRDNISLQEGSGARDQYSIDILNNDLYVGTDDAVEADYGMGNVRVMRNRITNCFVGLSAQPSLGGPTYFIRNVMYNILYSPFKLHNGSIGDVALHNTTVKNGDALAVYSGVTHARGWFRNNLYIGGPGGTYGGYENGTGKVADLARADGTNSFNFDAYGSILGTFTGLIGSASFNNLNEMRTLTSETNAVQVDLTVFNSAAAFPSDPLAAEMAPADLRIKAGSPADNAGQALANINDGFAGAAPDIGAYELGAPVPVYGPRPPAGTVGFEDDPWYPGQMALVVRGTAGNDAVLFTPVSSGTRVRVEINGVHRGEYDVASFVRILAYGKAGNDALAAAAGLNVALLLDGGKGNDTLTGGQRSDLLLGRNGGDSLDGAQGKDLLFAGHGADLLRGGPASASINDSDLLIASRTAYDGDMTALKAISQEWTSSRAYAERTQRLATGADGLPRLDATTVSDDGLADQLLGGHSNDWFFASLTQDLLGDTTANERVN